MVNDPANEQEDAEDVVAAQAEAAARADAFQAWWSGPFGDNYRNIYKKVTKTEAYDAFRAGWAAVLDAMVDADDYTEPLLSGAGLPVPDDGEAETVDPVDDFLPSR